MKIKFNSKFYHFHDEQFYWRLRRNVNNPAINFLCELEKQIFGRLNPNLFRVIIFEIKDHLREKYRR